MCYNNIIKFCCNKKKNDLTEFKNYWS